MEEDWDMCESILEFSGKKQEEEKIEPEDNVMETNEGENKNEERNEETTVTEEKCDSSNQEENPAAKPEPKSKEPKTDKPKEATKSSDCLYHGAVYRSPFQQMLNLMRGTKMLPHKFAKRVGQAVCICKDTQDVTPATFEDDHLRTLLSGMLKHFKSSDRDNVKDVVKSLLTVGAANNSVWKLYEVLSDGSNGVYTRIEFKPVKQACEKDEEKENKPSKVKEAITLPLPNQYVPHFVGRKGVHINELTKLLGIQLSIVSPQRRSYRAPDGPNAIVEVTADTQEVVDAAREKLFTQAKNVAAKREKHNQRVVLHAEWVRKRWEEKRKRRAERNRQRKAPLFSEIIYGTNTDGGYMKEMNRNACECKYLQYKKTGNTLKAKPPPVLEGSTCINCLGTYDDTKKNSVGSCRYHPGFLKEGPAWVEFRWDCCSYEKRFTRVELINGFGLKYANEQELRHKVEKVDRLKRIGACSAGYGCRHEGKRTITWGSAGPVMWSCCKLGATFVSSKDDKHDMHISTGCTEGLHTWRPQRNSKSSNRVKEQGKGKGKKSNRATYNMTDISKGLKKVSLNGGRKHAKQAIDEVMDDWFMK